MRRPRSPASLAECTPADDSASVMVLTSNSAGSRSAVSRSNWIRMLVSPSREGTAEPLPVLQPTCALIRVEVRGGVRVALHVGTEPLRVYRGKIGKHLQEFGDW